MPRIKKLPKASTMTKGEFGQPLQNVIVQRQFLNVIKKVRKTNLFVKKKTFFF